MSRAILGSYESPAFEATSLFEDGERVIGVQRGCRAQISRREALSNEASSLCPLLVSSMPTEQARTGWKTIDGKRVSSRVQKETG
jgi:hypothetical protein